MTDKCLVVATDLSNGELLYCRRNHMNGEYAFAGTLTGKGRPSKKAITREMATEFTFADAVATFDMIERRFGHVKPKYRWIDDWRVVTADEC